MPFTYIKVLHTDFGGINLSQPSLVTAARHEFIGSERKHYWYDDYEKEDDFAYREGSSDTQQLVVTAFA